MIHTGKEAAAGKSAVQRKIVVKYLFFKANAKLVNAFKKRPVFTIMLMVKSGKNSGKIRDFFFLRKHSNWSKQKNSKRAAPVVVGGRTTYNSTKRRRREEELFHARNNKRTTTGTRERERERESVCVCVLY